MDPSGGGRRAGSTIVLPRRGRVLIGVDDTDNPEEGATWTLTHRIAQTIADDRSLYLTHTIVQLFPVPFRTKNCVATVCEFASSDPGSLVTRFRDLLEEHTLSKETGMAVFAGFDPSPLSPFSEAVRRGQVGARAWEEVSAPRPLRGSRGQRDHGSNCCYPWYTRFEEAVQL